MDPVYTDVKGRSTRYCAFYLGQAQDVDTGGRFFYSPYLCISFDWWRLGGCRVARSTYLAPSSFAVDSTFSASFFACSKSDFFMASTAEVSMSWALS